MSETVKELYQERGKLEEQMRACSAEIDEIRARYVALAKEHYRLGWKIHRAEKRDAVQPKRGA